MELTQVIFSIAMTVVGSFWGYYLTRTLDKRSLPKIEASRRRAMEGHWVGEFHQQASLNRPATTINIHLEIQAGRRQVTGKMWVEDNSKFEFKIQGAFYHNRYLRLNYTAFGESESAIDFGSLFLILGDFPKKMHGNLAGYGSLSETLIAGTLELTKQD